MSGRAGSVTFASAGPPAGPHNERVSGANS